MDLFKWCTCRHPVDQHVRGVGRCKGLCSYGLLCQCPGVELDRDDDDEDEDDEDEDDDDDDW